jgi:hypothetical protein
VKKNFVSISTYTGPDDKRKRSISLFDANLNKMIDLYRSETEMGMGVEILVPSESLTVRVWEGRIYVAADKRQLVITVFDHNGKKEYRIRKEVELIPVNASYKKWVLDWYKNDTRTKPYWSYFKRYLRFQDVFPAIRNFEVVDNRIFVMTYRRRRNESQWMILDSKGNVKKHLWLPHALDTPITSPPITIYNGKYYCLIENEDSEMWELIIKNI